MKSSRKLPKLTGFLRALHTAAGLSGTIRQPLLAGKLSIPGYEIQEELGRGGNGVVYKARQLSHDRTVALKVVRADAGGTREDRKQFYREAEAAAHFQHANIVQIYDVGECNGRPYLALEYVGGGSLADLAGGRPVPPRVAARIIEQLARGVQCAHNHQIVHCDLKPANVLLVHSGPSVADTTIAMHDTVTGAEAAAQLEAPPDDGWPDESMLVPKIADFGIAKRIDQNGPAAADELAGTAQYMAPELMQASARSAVRYPVDIYSLGAILYELLTGRPPFVGQSRAQIFLQALTADPVRPRDFISTIPPLLEAVCLKCLEKDPLSRYPSAGAVADDLRCFLDGRSAPADGTRAPESLVPWWRTTWFSVVVAVALASTTALLTILALRR